MSKRPPGKRTLTKNNEPRKEAANAIVCCYVRNWVIFDPQGKTQIFKLGFLYGGGQPEVKIPSTTRLSGQFLLIT